MTYFSSVSLFALLVISSPVSSQSMPSAEAGIETIIISGDRFGTPLDHIGQSVSVITADDIDLRQNVQVFDALATVPGIQTQSSGPLGTVSTVFVRGAPSSATLMVQDGIVLNSLSDTSGGFNFANFDTSDIERIEVIRGAQSTLYGSDAIGGIINVITKSGEDGFGGSATIEAGSFGTVRGHGTVYGGDDRLHGRLTFSGQSSDGFSAQVGNDENDGFENITLSGRVTFKPVDTLTLDAVLRYSDSEIEFDAFGTNFALSNTEEVNVAAFATYDALDGRLTNRVGLTYSHLQSSNLNDNTGDEVPNDLTFQQEGGRLSLEYQGSYKATDWLDLLAGAEYEEAEADVPVAFISFNEQIEQSSAYGLVRIKPTDWIDLTAGIRHDDHSRFGGATTANATANIRLEETGTTLRGSYSEGFKAPTPGQLGANVNSRDFILAAGLNPDLAPETSTGWDLGVQQDWPIFGGVFGVTYFRSDIKNLIAFDFVGGFSPVNSAFFNVDEVSTEGVEIMMSLSPIESVRIEAAYTYLEAIDVKTGIQLDNRPEDRFTFDASWAPTSKLNLGAQLIYNGDETESFGAPLDSFVVVNIRADYDISEQIEVFARIDNLFDEDYFDNSGFNTAPLSAYGGFRVRF